MLDARIIVPMEEYDWISPMALQHKMTEEILICVELHSLNAFDIHDPFPTPFIDKVLKNVSSREYYSFMDSFYGHNQFWITEEDQAKTTFVTKRGSFVYTIIPFVLKNSLEGFSWIVVAYFKEFIDKFLEVYLDD
jgi:hypothetical protein